MDKSPREVSITQISIKKENLNNDIKEFAETAMNELLGWYGYSPRDDSRNATKSCRSHSESNSSSPESHKFTDTCGWCGKAAEESTSLCSSNAVFCSEMCFSQSRRASFKKSKTCDWCKHVRHTVSYVDFQDGASQLQFCSDKCLNQYKMHIFCRETRAHLEMHPHFPTESTASGTLITPDLWLKNCRTPDTRTPSPRATPPPLAEEENHPQTSPLPLISVTHPSKLMSLSATSPEPRRSRKPLRKSRKRCPATITSSPKLQNDDFPQDLRVRAPSNDLDHFRPSPQDPRPAAEQCAPQDHRVPKPEVPKSTPQPEERLPPPQYFQPHFVPPQRRNIFEMIPPPTVLLPYPLVIPLPIPIPIPIPLRSLIKDDRRDGKDKKDSNTQTEPTDVAAETAEKVTPVENENVDAVMDNNNEEEVMVTRPLRKRKRMMEKPKMMGKNKVPK